MRPAGYFFHFHSAQQQLLWIANTSSNNNAISVDWNCAWKNIKSVVSFSLHLRQYFENSNDWGKRQDNMWDRIFTNIKSLAPSVGHCHSNLIQFVFKRVFLRSVPGLRIFKAFWVYLKWWESIYKQQMNTVHPVFSINYIMFVTKSSKFIKSEM